MAAETILVIDADPDTDEKITTALEAEGYLVFSGSSQVVTAEMAEKLRPSLIYLKPLSPSAAGFEPCKTIHTIPLLKDVPIIILASLKGSLDPRYTTYYGIVDFLNLSFTPDELIKKTEMFLEFMRPAPGYGDQVQEEEESTDFAEPPEEPMEPEEPKPREPEKKPDRPAPLPPRPQPAVETRKQNPFEEDDSWDSRPLIAPVAKKTAPAIRTVSGGQRKRSPLLPVLIAVLVLVILGGGGFLAYQFVPQVRETVQKLTGSAPQTPQTTALSAETAPAPPAENAPPAGMPSPQLPAPPAETPVPAAAPARPASAKPSYSVQVGAYKTEEIAASLAKKLQGKGYEAFAQKGVTKDNSPVIRVLVGKFEDRKAAVKLAGEIQAKEQLKTTIFIN